MIPLSQNPNQLSEQHQEPLIRENLPYDRIARNPNSIPLINGSNKVTLTNGTSLELTRDDRVVQYHDQLLLKQGEKLYFKKSGSETFEELVLFEENQQSGDIKINSNSFIKHGIIIAERLIRPKGERSYVEYWIDGTSYKMDSNTAVGFGSNTKLKKQGNQLYYEGEHSGSLQVYNLDPQNHEIILSKELVSSHQTKNSRGSFLDDGTPVIKGDTTLKVGDKHRKNQLSSPHHDTISNNHPFLVNREELIINDESWYRLDPKTINEKYYIEKIAISPDGKLAGLSIQNDNYHKQGSQQLLIIDKNQVHKTLEIGDKHIAQIYLYDKDHYVYLSLDRNTGYSFHFNDYSFPLEIEDHRGKIQKAEFIDAETFLFSYRNKNSELIHQKISLNPHAEAIKKDKEAREEKEANQAAILTLLAEKGIESPEKLAELLQQATKYPQQEKIIQALEQENQEKEFSRKNLEEGNKQATMEYTATINELQKKIKDITEGISTRTFGGYNIDHQAKKLLGI